MQKLNEKSDLALTLQVIFGKLRFSRSYSKKY